MSCVWKFEQTFQPKLLLYKRCLHTRTKRRSLARTYAIREVKRVKLVKSRPKIKSSEKSSTAHSLLSCSLLRLLRWLLFNKLSTRFQPYIRFSRPPFFPQTKKKKRIVRATKINHMHISKHLQFGCCCCCCCCWLVYFFFHKILNIYTNHARYFTDLSGHVCICMHYAIVAELN